MNLLETFCSGMQRPLLDFLPPREGTWLNLGAGANPKLGCVNLDQATGWLAPRLPYEDESIAAVFAFHFMEHLSGELVIDQLREIERVLEPGGVFNSVIPHWSCELAFQDLDHKSFWSETTWQNLMNNPNYHGRAVGDWQLDLRTCIIMGIVSRNLVIVTQMEKI